MNNPYQMSDKAAKLLQKKAIKRFEQAKRDCSIAGFDELSVIKTIKKLYADLAKDNEETFFLLAGMAYEDAQVHGSSKPTKKWLNKVLDEYDPVALYIYLNEIDRKRDYATEAIIAAKDKPKEFRRALNYWTRMTAHVADRVTDEATIKAYKDAGVEKVVWKTEEDDKVCEVCGPKDNQVYPINKIPSKPHLNCRCWLVPYTEPTKKEEKKDVREQKSEKGSKDVTQDYLDKATPGKGEVSLEDGYSVGKHKDEIETAHWLKEKFGGFIKALKESEKSSVETPDYEWNGKLWERKRASSINGADKRLQKAFSQIGENPGGVVLYINASDLDMKLLEDQLLRRFLRDETTLTGFDLILFVNGEFVKVLRYKK